MYENRKKDSNLKKRFIDYKTRVRCGETDKMKVAYYASYAVWFEAARSEYGRQIGMLYFDLEKSGRYLVVAELYCRYSSPLRYDDEFIVRTTIEDVGSRSIKFGYEVYKSPKMVLCAKGYTNHICVNKEGKSVNLPPSWQELAEK